MNSNTHSTTNTHKKYNKYTWDTTNTYKSTTIHARQIRLLKMHIRKTHQVKKVQYVISNGFPIILHHGYYISPSLLTTLPPIYTLPITPRFHPFPTLHFTTLPITLLHFTALFNTFRWFSLHFLPLHFKVISLTHLNNRFPYPLFQGILFAGESS